jgi:serine phosphatase RsbU (regulator of sigma subunit)
MFVLFKPKDIVSGDFYWATKDYNGNFVFVTADCTGHGVPGAIMSILIIKTLEQAIEKGFTNPAEIFNYTRKHIIDRLKNDGSEEGGKDGMDANILSFNSKSGKIIYTAAHNPIWVYRNGEIIELECDRMPVGKHEKDNISFNQFEFELHKSDILYTFTDGFADQFGGPKNKKYTYKRLKETIIQFAPKPLNEQKESYEEVLLNWKKDEEQIDDITFIGLKLS